MIKKNPAAKRERKTVIDLRSLDEYTQVQHEPEICIQHLKMDADGAGHWPMVDLVFFFIFVVSNNWRRRFYISHRAAAFFIPHQQLWTCWVNLPRRVCATRTLRNVPLDFRHYQQVSIFNQNAKRTWEHTHTHTQSGRHDIQFIELSYWCDISFQPDDILSVVW